LERDEKEHGDGDQLVKLVFELFTKATHGRGVVGLFAGRCRKS
jgi:hypothetical protein